MSDQDVFENKPGETPPTPNDNPWEDKLTSIVNESGEPKYKDVETALDALKASQDHIKRIEEENKTLKSKNQEMDVELAKMGSIDDFVNRIATPAQPKPTEETPPKVETLSEDKVAEMLQATLANQRMQEVQEANVAKVTAALVEAHGDQANAFISQKAKELDTTPAALKEMAKSNPTVVLNLLGGGGKSKEAPAPQLSAKQSPTQLQEDGPPKFEKGVARGGFTNKELVDRWKQVAEYTNKQLGVES